MLDVVGLSPGEACAVVIGPSCETGYNPFDQPWNVTLPNTHKPPVNPIPPPKVQQGFCCVRVCVHVCAYEVVCTCACPVLCIADAINSINAATF